MYRIWSAVWTLWCSSPAHSPVTTGHWDFKLQSILPGFFAIYRAIISLDKVGENLPPKITGSIGVTGLGCSLSKPGSSSASRLSASSRIQGIKKGCSGERAATLQGVTTDPAAVGGRAGCPPLPGTTLSLGTEVLAVFPGPSVHVCRLHRADLTRNV